MYAELARKKCNECGEEKDVSEFYFSWKSKKPRHKISYRHLCKECERKRHAEYVEKHKDRINAQRRENYKKNPEKHRAWSFERKYKITISDFDAMLIQQDGCCAICKIPETACKRRLDVDHCHKTGRVRGLLCSDCNTAIGLFQDNPVLLKAAIKYLKSKK